MEIGMILGAACVMGIIIGFGIRVWIGKQSPAQRRAKLMKRLKAEDHEMWRACLKELAERKKFGIN
jgi:hypothetical protein